MAFLSEWLSNMNMRLILSDDALIAVFGCIILLLTGLLLYLRRMRTDLEREASALKKSESHLRTMSDTLQDIIIFQLVHDEEQNTFRFPFIGSGCDQVLGMSRSRIMNDAQLALDHVYEEGLLLLQQAYAASRDRLEPVSLELRILDAEGAYKWIHISAIPQRRDRNLVWDGFIQDITDKKDAEQSVAEESRNFQNLFETIDDFLVVCDMEGKLLHSNPALARRLGYSRNELADMSIFELYARDAQTEIYQRVAQLSSEPSATCDLPLLPRDGPGIPVEMNLFQGTWKHRKAIFGVARDVARHQQTEHALRESQRMLQLIIDSIPMAVFWKDRNSVYQGCNKAFIDECRLNSREDAVGRTPHDLFEPAVADQIAVRDQGVINTNQSLINHSESHTRPDGSSGRREVSLIPLRDERGRADGVLGIWRDVTEQNRAEERLKRTLEDMERFNQLMRGRERRTLELKDEINDLLHELGRPGKYRTTAEGMT